MVVAVLPPAEPEDAAFGGGRCPLPELVPVVLAAPPPVSPLSHIPKTAATRMAVSSCQVLQERRSLILSSPGWGTPSADDDPANALS